MMLLPILIKQDRKFLLIDKKNERKNCATKFNLIPGFITVLKISAI